MYIHYIICKQNTNPLSDFSTLLIFVVYVYKTYDVVLIFMYKVTGDLRLHLNECKDYSKKYMNCKRILHKYVEKTRNTVR